MIVINDFISKYVTKRSKSLFHQDLEKYNSEITKILLNKKILVIGGAGSIGSEFILQCLKFKVKSLSVIDINENALTELTRNLRNSNDILMPQDYSTYPIDYADPICKKIIKEHNGFDIIANFSAHKHVRSEKDVFSLEAMINNNVLKTWKFLKFLKTLPPEHYFSVSTDKAANPVNMMGASKKIMEDVIFSFSNRFSVKSARFANVAFSNGSLPAGFLNRIAQKQPLAAPTDIYRYFVSPPESGELCLLANTLGKNKEIFFPKLEKTQMLTFTKIAEDLLKYYGYTPYYCKSEEEAKKFFLNNTDTKKTGLYPVFFTQSDTTGEKNEEEFVCKSEVPDLSRFHSIGVISNQDIKTEFEIDSMINRIDECIKSSACKQDIVELFQEYIPTFNHIERNKSLDTKL